MEEKFEIRNSSDKLKAVIQAAGQRVFIVMTHWDMDAAAAAADMKEYCEHLGVFADIFSAARPQREHDKLAYEVFRLNHLPIESLPQESPFIILVDAHAIPGMATKPRIVIDHHTLSDDEIREAKNGNGDIWRWHQSLGACASMTAQLLFEADVPEKRLVKIATLTVLGILGDTTQLTSPYTQNLYREMLARIVKYANQSLVHLISTSTMSKEFLRFLHIATDPQNCKDTENAIVVCLGEKPDGCEEFEKTYMPKIAAMFLSTRGVNIVYVWGVLKNENQLIVKVRNSDMSRGEAWLNDRLKKLFGPNAGAKHGAEGGANIDLGPLGKTTDREALLRACRAWIEPKLLHEI